MSYKYKLSLCVCIKNESTYIIEFIKHYVNQGVEHFYIINNNSNDNLEEVIEKTIYNSSITIINNDRCINISDGYSHSNGIIGILNVSLYEIVKKETEWAIVVDIDEFMYGKNGFTIKTFLEKVEEDVGCIYVIWNVMTLSKIDGEINNLFNPDNFKRLNYDLINELSRNVKNANDFGKSIFRTSMLNGSIGLHKTYCTTGKVINNYGENKNSSYDNCNNIEYSENSYKNTNISLNHYVIRHLEDYSNKKKSLEENIEQRNAFLKGVFELFDLGDKYFVFNNQLQ